MKILVTGGEGILGSAMQHACPRGVDVVALAHRECDVTRPEQVHEKVKQWKPDVVIHCAAFTAVDRCETERERAFQVNADGTLHVAKAAAAVRAKIIYPSTDYVFDGEKSEPYEVDDPPNPLNEYGKSKLAGERFVQEYAKDFLIIRTSWLFGLPNRCFPRTILEKARRGERLQVVNDQVGSPTYGLDLAEKIFELLHKKQRGIFHVTNAGSCSWMELARATLDAAGFEDYPVEPVASDRAGFAAARPRNSRLSPRALLKVGIAAPRPWREAIRDFLKELMQDPQTASAVE